MKKHIRTFAFVIISVLCVTLCGCIFIRGAGDINNLPDSTIKAEGVKIETIVSQTGGNSERKEMSMVDAVAMVERSSVVVMTTSSVGSGVLIDVSFSDNQTQNANYVYIITCFHMIKDKGVVNVIIPDKNFSYENTKYIYGGVIGSSSVVPYYLGDSSYAMDCAVTLVGGDQESDIAVLRLDLTKRALSGNKLVASDLVTAKIPPVEYKARRGETVFSVGNPTGSLPGTVSSGIISYLEREVAIADLGTMVLMQIDVPTNPGNSGGGLYNLYGELIGITNAGLEKQHGLNNAIPISVMVNGVDNGFVSIARQLIATETDYNFGYVTGRREKMGFTVTKTTEGGVEYVTIAAITSGSQASNQGLKVGDVVKSLSINNTDYNITSYEQFVSKMGSLNFGDVIKLTVLRSGTLIPKEVSATFTIKQFIFCDTGYYPENPA